jgi:DNA modification methylase
MSGRLLIGDVREKLSELPDRSVDCVITSPPYWQLRSYGVDRQIGLEPTVDAWVDELRLVLRGLARVLTARGCLWLNLGDTYSRGPRTGAPAKSLVLAPERLLLAAASEKWIVRNKVIWAKTNPMPHSVSDRLSNSYDVVYFLTRAAHGYFFDLDAIRLPHRSAARPRRGSPYPPAYASPETWRQTDAGNRGLAAVHERGEVGHPLGKNPGDVWSLPVAHFRGAHFATFPQRLVERPLLASCPERVCRACELPFRRRSYQRRESSGSERHPTPSDPRVLRYRHRYTVIRTRGPLEPRCACSASSRRGVVLDPFFGVGTVGVVAERYGRDWVGIEINPEYARLARRRLREERADRAADGPPASTTVPAVAGADQPSTREGGAKL